MSEWIVHILLSPKPHPLETSGKGRKFKTLVWLPFAWHEMSGAFCFLSKTLAGQGWHSPSELWGHSDSFLLDLQSVSLSLLWSPSESLGSQHLCPSVNLARSLSSHQIYRCLAFVEMPNKERKFIFFGLGITSQSQMWKNCYHKG